MSCPSLEQLDALAAGDPATAQLDAHLQTCDRCRDQLKGMRANLALFERVEVASRGEPVAIIDEPPVVAGFTIEGEVHRGGQGIVYRARQTHPRRTVALKVLLAGTFATSRQRRRFEREIDLVAGLRHPNVVTVYESGVTDDGHHWLAMEYINGEPLNEHLDRRSDTTPRGLAALGVVITRAVGAAHRQGVIHRDLKPANILIDTEGEPHVVDFGLARPLDPEIDAERAVLTVEGGFVGTLAYAAPEQVGIDATPGDVRSDVYALGVVLYEALAGRRPYASTGRFSEVARRIVETPPAPLEGREGLGRIDDDLRTIVLTALAKDPDRRYVSADALGDDLDRYLVGAPIEAKRDNTWYVARKLLRRHRLAIGLAGAAVVVLIAFGIMMSVAYNDAQAESNKLAKINVFLEDTLGSVESSSDAGAVTVREMFDEGVQWIDLVLADEPEVEAAVRTIIGNGYRNLGLLDDAETQHQQALALRRARSDDRAIAKSLMSLGLVRRDEERYDEAMALFDEALAIRRRIHGDDHLDVAMVHANRAGTLLLAGRLDEAEETLRTALGIRRQLRGPDHVDVAMCFFNLARIAEQRGAYDDAYAMHEHALDVRIRVLHRAHPDLVRSLVATANAAEATGDVTAAVEWRRQVVDVRTKTLGPLDRRTVQARADLAACIERLAESNDVRDTDPSSPATEADR